MKRDQVQKKKLEVGNKFKEEIEVHAKSVETELKLNCVKTEVDMTETKRPRPLNQTLSKSWFAQKIAEALRV